MNKLILKYSWLLIPLLAIPYFTLTGNIYAGSDYLRYLAVAWHMYASHNYLIPIVNGAYYPDKGPLFFWIIALGWHLFGVGLFWPQLVVGLLLVATVWLSLKIYRLIFPDDTTGAELLPFIYIGAPLAFDLVQFRVDLLIVFLGVAYNYAVLSYFYKPDNRNYYWLILFAAGCTAIGVLTKGPIIFIFTLIPILIMTILYKDWRRFFIPTISGSIIGIGLVIFLWLIPTLEHADNLYLHEILFHEITKRMTINELHGRPFWFYLLCYLPHLSLPWIINFIWLKKAKGVFCEFLNSAPFLLWICITTIVIFSIFSKKEPWYILPLAPYLIMLFSRFISINIADVKFIKVNRIVTKCSLISGCIFLYLFCFNQHVRHYFFPDYSFDTNFVYFQTVALLLILSMLFFTFYKITKFKNEVKLFAIFFALTVNFFLGMAGYARFITSNHISVAKIMHSTDQKHYPIITYKTYYWGELGYVARLNNVIGEINTPSALQQWILLNPQGLIITDKVCPADTKAASAYYYSTLKIFKHANQDKIFLICRPYKSLN